MLKLINVKDVRTGMYVKEMTGSWLNHPFWKSSFNVSGPEVVQKLRASGVQELWIDTDRGVDVQRPADAPVPVAAPQPKVAEAVAVVPVARPADEAERAAQILGRGKRVVTQMLRDARLGKLSTDEAMGLVGEISDSVLRSPDAFITVARLKNKDEYTYLHSVAVCALMVALARQLQMSPDMVRLAGYAGLMHDVGKVGVPEEILNKAAKLSDQEFTLIKAHPEVGARLLRETGNVPEEVIDVCLRHHERMDGKGYPGGLKGDEISLLARMGSVCDVYDAVTSERCYKRAWGAAEAVKRMAGWAQDHFDERIFKAFVKCIGIYPLGSLVRLSSDRLAVIVKQGEESLLAPEVKVFYSIRSASRIVPETLDLARSRERIVSPENPEAWNLSDIHELWRQP